MLNFIRITGSAAAVLAVIVAMTGFTPAQARLKCKDVHGRWQICGDAKPFKSFTIGVGVRFNEKKPGLADNTAPERPHRPADRRLKTF